MKITLKLFATLRVGREKESIINVSKGSKVDDILKHLGISKQEATILMVNGRHVKPEHILNSGDTLSLFPPVGGG